MSLKGGIDIYVAYTFLKRLVTPFVDTEAFKLGLIDAKGKKVRSPKSGTERDAWTIFDRVVFNIKKLLNSLGGESKIKNYAAALLMLREGVDEISSYDDERIRKMLMVEIKDLEKHSAKSFKQLIEDTPTNATGSAVVGTGSDPVHWRVHPTNKRKKRQIDGIAFLRRRRQIEKKEQMTAAEKILKKARQQHGT
jgi:hypothetical protein